MRLKVAQKGEFVTQKVASLHTDAAYTPNSISLPDDLLNNVITSEEIQLSPADVQHHLQQAASLLEMDEPDALEKAAQPLWTLRVDMRLRNAHYAQIGDKKEGPDAMSTSIVKTLANITALACGRMQKSHTPAQRAQTISFGQQALRLLCTCHGADPASASEAAVRAVLTFAAFMAASNEKGEPGMSCCH